MKYNEEAYLEANDLQEKRKNQIVGYKDANNIHKYSRGTYKAVGLIFCFTAYVLSHASISLGFIFFGIGLFVYSSGPSQYAKRIYLYETILWSHSFSVSDYDTNKCPSCGASVEMSHKLVTECPACKTQLCKFGAELRIRRN